MKHVKTIFASALALTLFSVAGVFALQPVDDLPASTEQFQAESASLEPVAAEEWEFTSRIGAARCRFTGGNQVAN